MRGVFLQAEAPPSFPHAWRVRSIRTTSCVLFTRCLKLALAFTDRLGRSSQTSVICESSKLAS